MDDKPENLKRLMETCRSDLSRSYYLTSKYNPGIADQHLTTIKLITQSLNDQDDFKVIWNRWIEEEKDSGEPLLPDFETMINK